MNILAIDFGTKNIGLAWCDIAIGVVLPFGLSKNVSEVVEVIKKERIDQVVVGLPLGLDGKENKNTERVKEFINDLKKMISNLPIEVYDERFSSQAADRMEGDASRDEKSAMILLQDYIEKNK